MTTMLLAHAVDDAFVRLAKLYGRQFSSMFEGADIDAIKVAWRREVEGLPNALDAIAWALRNLPEKCPNAIQFRNLCRQAPDQRRLAQQEDASAPVRGPTRDELDRLHQLRDGVVFRAPSRQWAFDIIDAHARGTFKGSTGALRMAQEVAGVPRGTIRGLTPDAVIVDEFEDFVDPYREEVL